MNNDDSQKITKKLNETGFPFQHWCLEIIRDFKNNNGGWAYRAITEYPYTFPPTNGPLLGVHGTIDVLAIRAAEQLDKTLVFLVMECKRADAKIKNWFFFQDKKDRRPKFIFSDLDSRTPFKEANHFFINQITFPDLGYSNPEQYDYCYQGIELNSNFENINLNQKEKVYASLKQVNHGLRAIISSNKKINGLTDSLNFSAFEHFLFIPVLVTTANLFITPITNYKEIRSGDLQSQKINYESKNWLTYEFPLPDFLSFRENGNQQVNYMTTFIVNHKSLIEFLSKIGVIYAFGSSLKPNNDN
jgi:hypothetical protein